VHWVGSSLAMRNLWVSLVWPIRRQLIRIISLLLRFGSCQYRTTMFMMPPAQSFRRGSPTIIIMNLYTSCKIYCYRWRTNTFWLLLLLYHCIYRCSGLRRPFGTDRTCPATVPWTETATLGTRRAPTNGDWARRWRQSPTGRQSSWTRTRRSTAATFSSSFAWKSHLTRGRCFRGNGAVAEEGCTTNLSHRWAAKNTRSSSKTSELKHYTIYTGSKTHPAVPIRLLQNNITLSFRLHIL